MQVKHNHRTFKFFSSYLQTSHHIVPASSIEDIYIHVQWNATLRRFKTWRSSATTLSILVSYVKIVKPKIVPGSTVKQHTDRENSMAPCRSVLTLPANWSDFSASWPANLSRKTDNASLARSFTFTQHTTGTPSPGLKHLRTLLGGRPKQATLVWGQTMRTKQRMAIHIEQ